jgi:predicted component of type VI protein secretion system
MGEEGTPKTEMINPALLDGVSANFIVKGPSGVEKAFPMRQITMSIGRSDQCDIPVKDSSMSGKHCEVSKVNGEIRVKDLGSSNGIWLNGERITDAELFDGDVIRCGQTSIRVDVVGGKKRPDAGMNPKLLAAIIGGCVLVLGAVVTVVMKNKAQKRNDITNAQKFVEAVRENQKSKPCIAVVNYIQEVAKQQNAIPKGTCQSPAKGEEAKKMVYGYRELAKTYDRIVLSLNDFANRAQGEATVLSGFSDVVVNKALKDKLDEAKDVVDQRNTVTQTFIGDWKKLSTATTQYAAACEAVFLQGNKAACSAVERGVQGKSAPEIMTGCTKGYDKAKQTVEDKLKEVEELTGGAEGTE